MDTEITQPTSQKQPKRKLSLMQVDPSLHKRLRKVSKKTGRLLIATNNEAVKIGLEALEARA
jgi:hypothetical protein